MNSLTYVICEEPQRKCELTIIIETPIISNHDHDGDYVADCPAMCFVICLLTTNRYQKYKSVELGDQLVIMMRSKLVLKQI